MNNPRRDSICTPLNPPESGRVTRVSKLRTNDSRTTYGGVLHVPLGTGGENAFYVRSPSMTVICISFLLDTSFYFEVNSFHFTDIFSVFVYAHSSYLSFRPSTETLDLIFTKSRTDSYKPQVSVR